MRILQHIEWSFQESLGGIEVYCLSLAHALRELGVETVFAAPAECTESGEFEHEGFRVFNYPRHGTGERITHWRTPDAAFPRFAEWLSGERFDGYHLHAWKSHANSHHVALARSLGLPVVLTCHLPVGTCARGTLLERGTDPCDGGFDAGRCTACLGYGLNQPASVRRAVAATPAVVADFLSERVSRRFLHEKLGRYSLVNLRFQMFKRAVALADRVISVCDWHRDVLVRNGFPVEKIQVSRLGISALPPVDLPRPTPGKFLEVAYLGRIRHDKGVGLLVDAIRTLPADLPIRLTIYGIANWSEEKTFLAEIEEIARSDSRLRYGGALDRDGVWRALASADVLAVPSQLPETGPLVVLEAHAVGTPVLGSGFGGIAESVRDGVDGWLVPHPELCAAAGWARALARLASDPAAVRQARLRMRPARTMADVAEEMHDLYRENARKNLLAPPGFVQRVFQKIFRTGGVASVGWLMNSQLQFLEFGAWL